MAAPCGLPYSYRRTCIYNLLFITPAAEKARDGRYCNAPLSVRLRPSVTFSFHTVTEKRIDVFFRNFAGTCTMSGGVSSLQGISPSITGRILMKLRMDIPVHHAQCV